MLSICFVSSTHIGSYNQNEIMGVVLKEGVVKDLSVGDVTIPSRSPAQVDGNLSKVRLVSIISDTH